MLECNYIFITHNRIYIWNRDRNRNDSVTTVNMSTSMHPKGPPDTHGVRHNMKCWDVNCAWVLMGKYRVYLNHWNVEHLNSRVESQKRRHLCNCRWDEGLHEIEVQRLNVFKLVMTTKEPVKVFWSIDVDLFGQSGPESLMCGCRPWQQKVININCQQQFCVDEKETTVVWGDGLSSQTLDDFL